MASHVQWSRFIGGGQHLRLVDDLDVIREAIRIWIATPPSRHSPSYFYDVPRPIVAWFDQYANVVGFFRTLAEVRRMSPDDIELVATISVGQHRFAPDEDEVFTNLVGIVLSEELRGAELFLQPPHARLLRQNIARITG